MIQEMPPYHTYFATHQNLLTQGSVVSPHKTIAQTKRHVTQAVNDSTLPSVRYMVFIPALIQP